VESSCKLGNEPSGSIKCWELPSGCTTCGLSSGTQLHRVSYLMQNITIGFDIQYIQGLCQSKLSIEDYALCIRAHTTVVV
jgi:hypothetical protein